MDELTGNKDLVTDTENFFEDISRGSQVSTRDTVVDAPLQNEWELRSLKKTKYRLVNDRKLYHKTIKWRRKK